MKKIPVLFLFVLSFLASTVVAQEVKLDPVQPDTSAANPTLPELKPMSDSELFARAKVFESDESMSKGIQPAIIVEVASRDEKLVEDVWKKFIKDYGGKTKKSKGGRNEFTTTGAEVVGINGVNPLNVYSSAGTGGSGNIEMKIWFDMGEEFLDSRRKEQYEEAERMLQKFAHEVRIEQTREELKEAEKKLKSLNSDLKSLANKNDGYHKDIEMYEKKIQEAKQGIADNEIQQEDTNKKIALQELLVDEIDRRLRELRRQ